MSLVLRALLLIFSVTILPSFGAKAVAPSSTSLQQQNGALRSPEAEIRLGTEYAAMIDREVGLIIDPVLNEYVGRVVRKLTVGCNPRFRFTTRIVKSDKFDVLAIPGGFLYLNSKVIVLRMTRVIWPRSWRILSPMFAPIIQFRK